jgi:RsiW-degrading membrane proteinase PrsW (M82 family)
MPRRPAPEPLETDERRIVYVAMTLWTVAFVVLVVFFRDDLRRHHSTWWLWSCGIGVVLGFWGLWFVRRRERTRGGRTRG